MLVVGRSAQNVPQGAKCRSVDLADDKATEAFANELTERHVDILVNNAGINVIAPFAKVVPSDFDRIQRVNVRAPFLLCRAVVPGMQQRGFGRIVNIASVFGVVSKAERGAYSASKFALDGLGAALAAEVAVYNILVNTVSPGFIETDLTRQVLGAEGMAEVARQVPIGRLGRPEEIAPLVAWLVSRENTFVTGQNIAIDGGFTRV